MQPLAVGLVPYCVSTLPDSIICLGFLQIFYLLSVFCVVSFGKEKLRHV